MKRSKIRSAPKMDSLNKARVSEWNRRRLFPFEEQRGLRAIFE